MDGIMWEWTLIALAGRKHLPSNGCLYIRYCRRDDLNRRMPGFKVALGYGLHVGWAIEGAIGEIRAV